MDPTTLYKESLYILALKIKEACSDPRPSYSVEGQTFDFPGYIRMLLDASKSLQDYIAAYDPAFVVSAVV